jgi:ribosomal protein S18 acetylase RimI-like enzyme
MKRCNVVAAEQDNPFFFTVYASSREAELASWGWSREDQLEFLCMQYQCQQRSYQMQYPHLESRIILFGSTPAGRILMARTGKQTVLVDISLLAEFQNLGIGSALLKEIQEEIQSGESLRLTVLKTNPARRLYERFGFQIHEVSEFYLTMLWYKP